MDNKEQQLNKNFSNENKNISDKERNYKNSKINENNFFAENDFNTEYRNIDELLENEKKEYDSSNILNMNNLDENRLISIIESYLFTFSEPVYLKDLQLLFKYNNININIIYIKKLLNLLEEKYDKQDSGLQIIKLEDKIQLVTKKDNFPFLEKVISKVKKKSLTQSAIETLTIIAYNQPTTKSYVEKIKGVKSDTTINRLLEANLIEECGRLDKIGRPVLYKTTELFLKYLNINSLKDLPDYENKKAEDDVKEE